MYIGLGLSVIVLLALGYIFNQRVHSVKNKIITGNFTINDIKWYEQTDKVAMNPAPEGERYVTVVFGATNNKKSVEWITPVTQSHILDADKNIRTIQLVENSNPFQAGPMNPSESRTGELSFLIPADDNKAGFCFYVTADDGDCVLLDEANKIN